MSVSVVFKPNRPGVDKLLHSTNGPYGQWLARKLNQARSGAMARANVDTGLMRSRIEYRLEMDGGKVVGILAAKTSYAKYVHDGTRYHDGNPFLTDAVRDTLR